MASRIHITTDLFESGRKFSLAVASHVLSRCHAMSISFTNKKKAREMRARPTLYDISGVWMHLTGHKTFTEHHFGIFSVVHSANHSYLMERSLVKSLTLRIEGLRRRTMDCPWSRPILSCTDDSASHNFAYPAESPPSAKQVRSRHFACFLMDSTELVLWKAGSIYYHSTVWPAWDFVPCRSVLPPSSQLISTRLGSHSLAVWIVPRSTSTNLKRTTPE